MIHPGIYILQPPIEHHLKNTIRGVIIETKELSYLILGIELAQVLIKKILYAQQLHKPPLKPLQNRIWHSR